MKRAVLVLVLSTLTAMVMAGCGGRLSKRVDRLETLYENSKILRQEVANMATSTGFKVDKMEGELKKLYEASAPAPPVETSMVNALEDKLAKMSQRVDVHEKRLDRHENKLSDLQRLIAEAEDEVRHDKPQKYYFWTTPFKYTKVGSSKLTKEIMEGLDMLVVDLLIGKIQLQKKVVGYTDPRGKKKFNEELAKKRAASCIEYLVKKLGPDDTVKWDPNTKWKDYFVSVAGGETDYYGSFKYSRRVRFEQSSGTRTPKGKNVLSPCLSPWLKARSITTGLSSIVAGSASKRSDL